MTQFAQGTAPTRPTRPGTALAVGLVAFALLALASCSSSGPSTTKAGAGATPTAAAGAPSASCPKADGSSPKTMTFSAPPPTCIVAGKTYTAAVVTTEGDFTITLDTAEAPVAVNNFVVLSRYHFYDGIAFHRIIPDFVDQVGDPTGTGSGGPGYDLPDENAKRDYKAGDVAMARAAKVSGSQLFLTVNPDGLNQTRASGQPDYPIIGEITQGMDVVKKIDTFGTNDETGAPTKVIKITSVTIRES